MPMTAFSGTRPILNPSTQSIRRAGMRDLGEIAAKTGVMNEAQGQQPGSRIDRCFEILKEDACSARLHDSGFDAAAGQVHPRVDVRRIFARDKDHIVARFPREPLGHHGEPARSVADECNFI